MLDFLYAPLAAVDGWLAWLLPAWARLLAWGGVAGSLGMGLYWALSPQKRLAELKTGIRQCRRALASSPEDPEYRRLLMRNLGLSFRLLGRSLLPAAASLLPVLILVLWVEAHFGHALPSGGGPVALHPRPAGVELAAEPEQALVRRDGGLALAPAALSGPVLLLAGGEPAYRGDPLHPPTPRLERPSGLALLVGGPAGHLLPGTPLRAVDLELPRRVVLPWAPSPLDGWEPLFFLALGAASLGLKLGFRIQ